MHSAIVNTISNFKWYKNPKKHRHTDTEISWEVQEDTIAKKTKEHKRLWEGQFPVVTGSTKHKKGIYHSAFTGKSEVELILPKIERFLRLKTILHIVF